MRISAKFSSRNSDSHHTSTGCAAVSTPHALPQTMAYPSRASASPQAAASLAVFSPISRLPATATALRPWNEAMAATGGVKTEEINYNTFESLKCPNLYITGELLDVDGKSGGFNLHFAWACGFTAAGALSKEN